MPNGLLTNGFTANSAKRLILGPGAVYLDYGEGTERLLGATRGGTEFDPGVTYRKIAADLPRENVKGLNLVDDVKPMIKAKLLEMSAANLLRLIPGLRSAVGSGITAGFNVLTMAEVADTDYINNVAVVGETIGQGGVPVVCIIKNVLGRIGSGLSFKVKDEVVIDVEFHAHYDPATLNTAPFEIRYPVPVV